MQKIYKKLTIAQIYIFLSIVIMTFVCGCSSLSPIYHQTTNSYSYNHQPITTNFVSSELIYTYDMSIVEEKYLQAFCANLSNCKKNIDSVRHNSIFGGINLNDHPISNNHFHIDKVNMHRILYTTYGQDQDLRKVSGAIFLPDMPKNKIRGVVLFFHPTLFSKTSVPSYAPDEISDISLVATFVANGYIVLSPDYIGMGYDKDVFHPYVLYPQVNAYDGLAMLQASNTFLNQQGYITNKKTMPLFVTGYSEGAGYSLWFSRLVQEQKDFRQTLRSTSFDLRMIAPISGVYNISGVMYNYLFSDIGIFNKSNFNVQNSIVAYKLKPSLLAYALTSYAYYSENKQFDKVFNDKFFRMECALQFSTTECMFGNKQLNLYEAFSQESDDFVVVSKINNSALSKTANFRSFHSQLNSVLPLINSNLIIDNKFKLTMKQGDIYYWHSKIPTTLIYLHNDSVVSSYNSIFAYKGMTENGSENLYQISVENSLIKEKIAGFLPEFNVDHISGFLYLYLVALNQFNNNLDTQQSTFAIQ